MIGHGHRFEVEKANLLIDKNRYEALPPNKIIEILKVNKGDAVADLGAGNGYFTLPIAKSTDATVYALDVEPKMLQLLEERAKEANIKNIQTVVSDLDHIKLSDQSVDKIIISFVLHEVPNLERTLSEMKRILNESGAGIIIEWEAKETEGGPPLHERIPSEQLAEIVENNGFKAEILSLNKENYGLYFVL